MTTNNKHCGHTPQGARAADQGGPRPRKGFKRMIVQYTDEEQRQLQAIFDKYEAQIKEDLEPGEDSITYINELYVIRFKEIEAKRQEFQRARVQALGKDPAAILKSARQQIKLVLQREEKELEDIRAIEKDLKPYERYGIITVREEGIFLKAEYLTDSVLSELAYHLEALQDDKKNKLYNLVFEAIEKCEFAYQSNALALSPKEAIKKSKLPKVKYHGFMNDNMDRAILKEGTIVDGAARWIVPQKVDKDFKVFSYIALSYEDESGEILKKSGRHDKAIEETFGTCFYYWHKEHPFDILLLEPADLWRIMNGKQINDTSTRPSPQQLEAFINDIDRGRFTREYINVSEEIKKMNLVIDDDRIHNGIIDCARLDGVRKITLSGDKVEKIYYAISNYPPLYAYEMQKNRLVFVDHKYLDVSSTISNSANVIEFRNYLLVEIERMKHGDKTRPHTMLLKTIYEKTQVPTPEARAEETSFKSDNAKKTYIRKTRAADCEKISGILTAVKEQGGFFDFLPLDKNRRPVKRGQRTEAYIIFLSEEERNKFLSTAGK